MEYKSGLYTIFKFFNKILMIIVIIATTFPYLSVVAKAFNNGIDTMLGGITIFPRDPTFENFGTVMKDLTIINASVLTVARVVFGVLIELTLQFAAAYVLTKKNLRYKKWIILYFAIPMFLHAGVIPTYVLYSKIHLLNSFAVYIIPYAFNFFNVVIMRTFMRSSIPVGLEESALLDGANEIDVLVKIFLPLSLPIIATIGLYSGIFHWNDWTTTLVYTTSQKLHTLQYKLMQVITESQHVQKAMEDARRAGSEVSTPTITPESIMAAQIVITTIPVVLVYPFLQKYFIKGIMIGSIKE